MKLILLFIAGMLLMSSGTCNENGVMDPPMNQDKLVLNDTLQVAYQDTVFNSNKTVWITFDSLLEDSRCPLDVICVWAGNAKVSFGFFADENKYGFSLDTHGNLTRDSTISSYKISLINVAPYPHTDSLFTPQDYSTKIIISK